MKVPKRGGVRIPSARRAAARLHVQPRLPHVRPRPAPHPLLRDRVARQARLLLHAHRAQPRAHAPRACRHVAGRRMAAAVPAVRPRVSGPAVRELRGGVRARPGAVLVYAVSRGAHVGRCASLTLPILAFVMQNTPAGVVQSVSRGARISRCHSGLCKSLACAGAELCAHRPWTMTCQLVVGRTSGVLTA